MTTLTTTQASALALLAQAAAGGSTNGAVRPGWGAHLRTVRSLEKLGLCTVTEHDVLGHMRHGRFIPPSTTWSARITEAGANEVSRRHWKIQPA